MGETGRGHTVEGMKPEGSVARSVAHLPLGVRLSDAVFFSSNTTPKLGCFTRIIRLSLTDTPDVLSFQCIYCITYSEMIRILKIDFIFRQVDLTSTVYIFVVPPPP